MANRKQIDEVCLLLQDLIADGTLTRAEIAVQCRDTGLSYKGQWAEKIASGIRQFVAHESPASRERRRLGLVWPAYHLLVALREGKHTLKELRQASGTFNWRPAVAELEKRGLILVERKDGDPRRVTLIVREQPHATADTV